MAKKKLRRNSKFVFYDKKRQRWGNIKGLFGKIFLLADVTALGFFLSIVYVPRFGSQILSQFSQKPGEVVDTLSAQKEDEIVVEGFGPILSLKKDNDTLSLLREEPEKKNAVVLSFDDGPDPNYTPKILEVLKKEEVKGVFFLIGEQMVRYPELTKQIVREGHQIGAHTFTHVPEGVDLYQQQDRLSFELDFPQKIVEAQTGYKTKLFRVPYWGAEDTITLNSLVLVIHALDRGYTIVPSTIDSFDWQKISAEEIASNSFDTSTSQIILMHDGGGDRSATIEALPEVINNYREAGFEFTPLDAIYGEPLMFKPNPLDIVTSKITLYLYLAKINFHTVLGSFYKLCLVFLASSVVVFLFLSLVQVVREKKRKKSLHFSPFVSVVVPAYNEENTIAKTVSSLLKSDYLNFEIIVVNNNSEDKTAEMVKTNRKNIRVRLVKQKVQGKYAALNKGIMAAKGEIIVAIDADTQVLPNTLTEIVRPFSDKKVAAVAGNLKVGNIANLLCAFQAIEYIVGLNLDRRAYDSLHAIQVVPGALGAWRKSVVKKAGGYKNDTLTEDADLTIRVQRLGYRVVFAGRAVAYTEAPETLKAFVRQRLRWTFGILQVLFKHKHMFFKKRHGVLGIVLPYILFIQIPFMLLALPIDILAIVFLPFFPVQIITYFMAYLFINFLITCYSFALAKERKIWLLIFLPLSRLIYQFIWYYVLYKSVITALKGVYVPWRKLTHFGTFKIGSDGKALIEPRLAV